MAIYLFWGEDDFAIAKMVNQMRQSILDPNWSQFNYDRISGDQTDNIIQGLNQAMTPVFGMGGRLVWLSDTIIFQHCAEDLLSELERTLPVIPDYTTLLFTCSQKPDGRLKTTKLVQKHGEIREFSLIPPWKTEEILRRTKGLTEEFDLKLTPKALELLAESVGNDSRQLWSELEKLKLYQQGNSRPLDVDLITSLVNCSSHNSLQLVAAIREGNTSQALGIVNDLLDQNEHPLRIVATLVGQFRLYLLLKLMEEKGEKDEQVIAKVAEISNPKRIYFLRQDIKHLSGKKLLSLLPVLLELESSLKRGADPVATLHSKIIELCSSCQTRNLSALK
jgi:DNA polymerase III subunit delta